MLVACLWSHWKAPGQPDLLSSAAITDEPPPEVAAAGHDRSIVPIKSENIDAGLRLVENEVRPIMDRIDGCRGLSCLIDRASGMTIITSSCGLNHLPRHIALGKLKAMTEAKAILSGKVI